MTLGSPSGSLGLIILISIGSWFVEGFEAWVDWPGGLSGLGIVWVGELSLGAVFDSKMYPDLLPLRKDWKCY